MKKAFSLLMAAMFVFATSLSAQTPAAPAKKEVKKEMKKEMKKGEKEMKKGEKMGKNMTPPPPPPPPPPGQVKKDVNAKSAKAFAPGQQHMKKDGTPDKRFKANKEGAAPKHMKKDGTPDKRFKGNKEPKK